MQLSVIIPAYNESDRIVPTLKHTLAYLERQPFDSEVIVVSDGSRDDTVDVVNRFAAPPGVCLKTMEYHPNRGKGYAVKTGMLAARGDHVMFMDADYSVSMAFYENACTAMRDGVDVAIASRAISGARITTGQSFFRSLSGKLYTLVQNVYLGFSYRDTQCGFKVFRRHAAHALFADQKLSSVIFDPEILFLARKKGFRVAEFPVVWTHQEDSRIQYDSWRKFLFVFEELFRIRKLHRK